jgi:hypothetical protein
MRIVVGLFAALGAKTPKQVAKEKEAGRLFCQIRTRPPLLQVTHREFAVKS